MQRLNSLFRIAAALVLFVTSLAFVGLAQNTTAQKSSRSESRREWKISFQLTPDRSVEAIAKYPLLWKLGYDKQAAVTQYVLTRLVKIVLPETKAAKVGLMFGPGGYKQNPLAPSAQLDVRGSPEEIQTLEEAIGCLAKQYEVIASRPDPDGDKPAFDILQVEGRLLQDPQQLQKIWNRIGELSPRLHQGFLPLVIEGKPAIRIINTEEPWTAGDARPFHAAIGKLGGELHSDFASHLLKVEFKPVINDWKQHPDGSVYLDSLRHRGRTGLANRLVKKYRLQVHQWTVEALRRYASLAAGSPSPK